MKPVYHSFLMVLLLAALAGCSRKKVVINLENYYWNSKHAIYSTFSLKNDLIYLKEAWAPFTGTIQLNQNRKPSLVYTIEDGRVVILEIDKYDEEGTYKSTYKVKDGQVRMSSLSEFQNIVTSATWTCNSFFNKDFIEGTIQERASESVIHIKKDGKSIESKISIRVEDGVNIKDLVSRNRENGEMLIKIISYKKMLKDSTFIEIDFTERGVEEVLRNSLHDLYSEAIKVSRGTSSLRLKTSYTQDKDVVLYSTLENLKGKTCKDLDFLLSGDAFPTDITSKKAGCVSEGLSAYGEITGKTLTREKLKERFIQKLRQKSLFSKTKEDMNFYF